MTKPRRIAIYGKGGIGKSTVVGNLSLLFRRDGHRVLQVGCDPKADSSHLHVDVDEIRPVLPDILRDPLSRSNPERARDYVVQGRTGVDCIEAGGPEPGRGCAGLGITMTLEILARIPGFFAEYDVVLYDVVGDVVCGGFAVPIRGGQVREVYVLLTGDVASIYAANNICRAVVNNAGSGARLAGVIYNRMVSDAAISVATVERLCARLATRLVGALPADARHMVAAAHRRTVTEEAPDSPAALACRELYNRVRDLGADDCTVPRPLENQELLRFLREESLPTTR